MKYEEYKLEILKQFRTPQSLMRLLMVYPNMTLRTRQNIYQDTLSFYVEEYKLYCHVAMVSEIPNTTFSVMFDEAFYHTALTQPYLKIKYGPIGQYRYHCDTIRFKNEKILFFLETFKLHFDFNNLPYKEGSREWAMVVFNIKTMNFELDDNLDVIVANWYTSGKSTKDRNVDFYFDGFEKNQLLDFYNRNQVGTTARTEITDCFQRTIRSDTTTTMTQIVFNLRDLVDKRRLNRTP